MSRMRRLLPGSRVPKPGVPGLGSPIGTTTRLGAAPTVARWIIGRSRRYAGRSISRRLGGIDADLGVGGRRLTRGEGAQITQRRWTAWPAVARTESAAGVPQCQAEHQRPLAHRLLTLE